MALDFISITRYTREHDRSHSTLGVYSDRPDVLSVIGVLPHGADIAPASAADARALIKWLEAWLASEACPDE